MDLLNELQMCDLDEEQYDLAECIGFESYKSLLATYGGTNVYIHLPETITKKLRNQKIRKAFKGDYKALAREYRLSVTLIREIVNGKC